MYEFLESHLDTNKAILHVPVKAFGIVKLVLVKNLKSQLAAKCDICI